MAAIKACAKARQWERALLIVTDDMAEYGVVPTVKSLNAVISACVKSGKLEKRLNGLLLQEGRCLLCLLLRLLCEGKIILRLHRLLLCQSHCLIAVCAYGTGPRWWA